VNRYLLGLALLPTLAHAQTAAPQTEAPQAEPAPAASTEAAAETGDDKDDLVLVVTPTKNPRRLSETTAAVTVISPRQLEAKKAFDITDVLRLVPSLNLVQSGARGKQASVFLRGASPSQTLVLIDGVRVNSPSFGSFDFGTFSTDNIERIEVLRGPQSGLYGSDAIGGVINIITKRGVGPIKTGGRLELGSDGLSRQNVVARGEAGQTRVAFSASRLSSDGTRQNDEFRDLAASLRLDRALGERSNLALITRFDRARVGIIGQTFGEDPNQESKPRTLFGSLQFTHDGARRRDKITLGVFDKDLRDNDPANPGDTFFGTAQFRDKVRTLEAQSAFSLGRHTLTGGVELRRQRARITSQSNFGPNNYAGATTTRAAFLQDEFTNGKNALVLSGRYEDNSQFGSDLNGRAGFSREIFNRTRFKASIGTGFQAPTIDQLYSPFGGNANLKPVENTTYEIGLEREMSRGGRAEVTVFRTRFKNLIGFDAAFNAVNVDSARGDGLEVSLDQPFGNGFRTVINAGLLNISSTASRNILRRPKYNATADLIYRRGKADFDFGVVSRGRGYDVGQAGTAIFGGHTRFDLAAGYSLRDSLKVYARINNLFDSSYQEVIGYPAPGRQFVIGLQTGVF
jgi:vitamin B12 transporter